MEIKEKSNEKYNILLRTLEDWESERRKPAEYIVELLDFKVKADIKMEEEIKERLFL